MEDELTDYPYAKTLAAEMLSAAIDRAREGRSESLRGLAAKLGYRSAVVLSHLRTGRLPIPVERAHEIARIVGMDEDVFFAAVLKQRYPKTDFANVFRTNAGDQLEPVAPSSKLAVELEQLAGEPLDELSPDIQDALREVAADPNPRRRWLAIAEVGAVEALRALRPDMALRGLSAADLKAIEKALRGSSSI